MYVHTLRSMCTFHNAYTTLKIALRWTILRLVIYLHMSVKVPVVAFMTVKYMRVKDKEIKIANVLVLTVYSWNQCNNVVCRHVSCKYLNLIYINLLIESEQEVGTLALTHIYWWLVDSGEMTGFKYIVVAASLFPVYKHILVTV